MSKFDIISKKGWGKKKPVERVVVDRTSELGSRVLSAHIFNTGNGLHELVSNQLGTVNGSPKIAIIGGEQACQFNGSTDYLELSLPSGFDIDAANGFTILSEVYLPTDTATGHTVASFDEGATGDLARLTVQDNVANNPVRAHLFDTLAINARSDVDNFLFGEWGNTAATFYHSTAASDSEALVYYNGSSTNTADSDADTGGISPTVLRIGARHNGTSITQYMDGYIKYVVVVAGRLSVAEIDRFYTNPYQILKPAARKPFFLKEYDAATVYADPNSIYDPTATGSYDLTADSGTYTLSGTDVTLTYSGGAYTLTADSGSYTYSGTDATLKAGWALAAASGTYNLNGSAVTLAVGRALAAESGSYALAGQDVTLTYTPIGGYTMTAEGTSYTISGTDASLIADRILSAEAGSITLTGTAAGTRYGRVLIADGIAYTVTGTDATLSRGARSLSAESASFTLTGAGVTLSYSGATSLSTEDINAIIQAMHAAGFLTLDEFLALK